MEAQAQQQHEWRHVRLQTKLGYCLGSLAQWTRGCSSHLEAFGKITLLPSCGLHGMVLWTVQGNLLNSFYTWIK